MFCTTSSLSASGGLRISARPKMIPSAFTEWICDDNHVIDVDVEIEIDVVDIN